MKKPHTPGPWRIDDSEISPLILTDSDEHETGAIVAKVFSNAEAGNDEPEEVNNANARLICAAPDMLDALLWAQDALGEMSDLSDGEKDVLKAIRAAIAKAKGN